MRNLDPKDEQEVILKPLRHRNHDQEGYLLDVALI